MRVLVSVYHKEGLADFCKYMAESQKAEIIATGGTAKYLAEQKIPCKTVEDYYKVSQLFDGRVKTLSERVFSEILMDRSNPTHAKQAAENGAVPLDMVVVNLYPFMEKCRAGFKNVEDAIENIDIGGVTLIRAAAKNFKHVAVIVDPRDYKKVMETMDSGKLAGLRRPLMEKAFGYTALYDSVIANHFRQDILPDYLTFGFIKHAELRYGENPHQLAYGYIDPGIKKSIFDATVFAEKQMSYNNYLDASTAISLIIEFQKPACAIIKHNNPCGGACADTPAKALELAYQTDPISAYGGIIALNRKFDMDCAKVVGNKFVDVILAPGYEADALETLKLKNGRRLLDVTGLMEEARAMKYHFKKVVGGLLYQTPDNTVADREQLKFVSEKKPTEQQVTDMLFAMTFTKHTKSNALAVARDERVLGIGAGQMSRVDACRLSIEKAKISGLDVKGAVAASDAFLPFRDTIDTYSEAGVAGLIQPYGSKRDEEVIKAANEKGMILVFANYRHFRH